MRKHDVRKWLHAILDLLPVIIIPVFMVYSHRHTIDTYQIETTKYQEIFMQQDVINGRPVGISNLDYDHVTFNSFDNTFECIDDWYVSFNLDNFDVEPYDKVLFKGAVMCTTEDVLISLDFDIFSVDDIPLTIHQYYNFEYITTYDNNSSFTIENMSFYSYYEDYQTISFSDIQCFNLTRMFGSGFEPTIDEFNSLFTDEYYSTSSTASVIIEHGTQIYDDTDIGSQMFYCLYNSVDKYFNMGNVFNLTGVYDWFNVNIFHGNVSPSIYVVWNIVLYEFVMDLLFLLYGLFMWFIDMVEKIMDKPFKSIK